MIRRDLEVNLNKIDDNKALIILGARQTGKTTMIKNYIADKENSLFLNADDPEVQTLFENLTISGIKSLFGDTNLIFLDEAQQIKNIGQKLKLFTDNFPKIRIIASGSSSFELSNKLNEPLTGRKWEYRLYPLSFNELSNNTSVFTEKTMLKTRLIYGSYPEVVVKQGNEKQILKQLASSYLYKDVLQIDGIKKSGTILKLLQALALQIGNEVSYNEISSLIGLDVKTTEKYIDILEKAFIIFRLNSLNRNMRTELKLGKKIYFCDNGIRNTLISNFQIPEMRTDIGALWENYIISERIKYLDYSSQWSNLYFWRTTDRQEIDLIEERNGKLYGFEFKWNTKKNARIPKSFINAYPEAEVKIISPENYWEILK